MYITPPKTTFFQQSKNCFRLYFSNNLRRGPKDVDCKSKEGGNANLVESNTIIAVVSEINLVGNTVEWIVDTGSTKHICANRRLLQSYEKIDEGENVFMGNSASALSSKKERLR